MVSSDKPGLWLKLQAQEMGRPGSLVIQQSTSDLTVPGKCCAAGSRAFLRFLLAGRKLLKKGTPLLAQEVAPLAHPASPTSLHLCTVFLFKQVAESKLHP